MDENIGRNTLSGTADVMPPSARAEGMGPAEEPGLQAMPVGAETIREWDRLLLKYKAGKAALDRRVKAAEMWWKLRNAYQEELASDRKNDGFRAVSSWLHNVIVSKHADAIEAYPSPNILPREEDDRLEAWALTKIVPVILKQNRFERIYDRAAWSRLKTGTGIYKVFWDAKKLNGLGDIAIAQRDVLNVFWEPGIRDIQDSALLFDVEMTDREALIAEYPFLEHERLSSAVVPEREPADDAVRSEGKVAVVDVYYKKGGRLHYAKYAGDCVLYATENDPARAERGLYDHGKYPYVFDVLYPVEDSPAGYGYVDVCANSQTRIDLLNTAFLRNTLAAATPRFFARTDGAVNEEEFLDLEKAIVHVTGNLGEESLRAIPSTGLSGSCISVLDCTVTELRETSGNTETSTGNITGGVTAASAITALQEASGKGSRAAAMASYLAYADVVELVIELIRQFYDMPRQFRITGRMGAQRYITFRNEGMQPRPQGSIGGMDMGYRLPMYDIDVVPERRNSYTRLSQNEYALQLYGLGFFDPQRAGQALLCLQMMDFDGKDELMRRIEAQGAAEMRRQLAAQQPAEPPEEREQASVPGRKGGKKPAKTAEAEKGRERASAAARP